MKGKTCTKCKIQKPLTDYYKKKAAKDGLQSQCNSCAKENQREFREGNLRYYDKYYRQKIGI